MGEKSAQEEEGAATRVKDSAQILNEFGRCILSFNLRVVKTISGALRSLCHTNVYHASR